MSDPMLSYQFTKPVSTSTKQWRSILWTVGVFCLIYAVIHIIIACNAWMLHGTRTAYYKTSSGSLSAFPAVLYFLAGASPPFQLTIAVVMIVGAIGVISYRSEFRQLLLIAVLALVGVNFLSAGIQIFSFLSQSNFIQFRSSMRTSDIINGIVYISGVITQQLYPLLPGLFAVEILRRVPASPTDEVFLVRFSSAPRSLAVIGAIAVVIGFAGLLARPIALFSRDPTLGIGLTPAWVVVRTPNDVLLTLWQFGSRLCLWICCLFMLLGGIAALREQTWARRMLATQALPAIVINTVDVCLTVVLIYQVGFLRTSNTAFISTMVLQCLSIAMDVGLRIYCNRPAMREWARRNDNDHLEEGAPTPVMRLNPGFDQQ